MKKSITQNTVATLMLVLSLSVISTSTLHAQDQKDAGWTAKQILTHYKAKDWKALSSFTTGDNTVVMTSLAKRENNPRYKSIVSGWRWKKVSAWDGKISEIRVGPRGAAFAKFTEQGKECFLVKMFKKENKWYFDDIQSPNCTTFNKYKAS